ncbi:MAG: hypothetical protein E7813_15290 [Bradyrhizobium sp.]|uniref:hypothetical protein n=1 Tax=Bradyrhizobium sp. TaxID=376 RepID=UPI0011F66CBA|nr:hypothetical protein [Bradyrhizobium sp.]THD65326.1 MAG: hypothetical protein E7813_15290 [Bradyrhizobium sp.]
MSDDYWVEVAEEHRIRFLGGPVDNPTEASEALAVIGHTAVSWARMEQHIDAMLIQINREQHSDELIDLYDENHPGTFDAKIKMLKRYFNKHPALSQYTETVIDCATGLKTLAEDRNLLMHGALQDYDPSTKMMTINSTKYQRRTDDFSCRTQPFSVPQLVRHAAIVNLAHHKLCEVSRQLFTVDAVERLQRPKRAARHWWRRLLDRWPS